MIEKLENIDCCLGMIYLAVKRLYKNTIITVRWQTDWRSEEVVDWRARVPSGSPHVHLAPDTPLAASSASQIDDLTDILIVSNSTRILKHGEPQEDFLSEKSRGFIWEDYTRETSLLE